MFVLIVIQLSIHCFSLIILILFLNLYFDIRLCMYYYLDVENQIQKIMNKVKLSDLDNKNLTDDLFDITDGSIYKKLLESENGYLFASKKAFTFSLNTDGISPYKKSKLTIWPVFLVINELPLEVRFSIDNTILAGNFFSLILIYLIEYFI